MGYRFARSARRVTIRNMANDTDKMAAPRSWPHPDTPLGARDVAKIIGRHRSSIEKPLQRLRAGEPPKTDDPEILAVAQILNRGSVGARGATLRLPASVFIGAIGRKHDTVSDVPPKAKKIDKSHVHRKGKKEIARMRRASDARLRQDFLDAYANASAKGTTLQLEWLFDIVEEIKRRETMPFPQEMFEGTTLDRLSFDAKLRQVVSRFAAIRDFGQWTRLAKTGDFRMFVLLPGSLRPVDGFDAPKRLPRGSEVLFLDIWEWHERMGKAKGPEEALREVLELGTAAPNPEMGTAQGDKAKVRARPRKGRPGPL